LGPDSRKTLRVTLQLQHEAEDAVVRVTKQLEQAKAMVTRLEELVADQRGGIAAGEAAAVEQLLSAFANGMGTSPEPANALGTTTVSLRTAQAARDSGIWMPLPIWLSNGTIIEVALRPCSSTLPP
jgi:hypothetical protein